jgi:hypothetical protein
MVARDGIEPSTPAFQGPLPVDLSGVKSADAIDRKDVRAVSILDCLGSSGMVSSPDCSRIVPAKSAGRLFEKLYAYKSVPWIISMNRGRFVTIRDLSR